MDVLAGADAYFSFEPFHLSPLVLQLCAQLSGCDLLRLQDLDEVDVLLHQDLPLYHNVRVAAGGTKRSEQEDSKYLKSLFKAQSFTAHSLWLREHGIRRRIAFQISYLQCNIFPAEMLWKKMTSP